MKIDSEIKIVGALMAILFFIGCHKKGTIAPELSVSPTEINLPAKGGTADITINGNGQWSISNSAVKDQRTIDAVMAGAK